MENTRIQKLETYLLQQPNDSFLQHALALEYTAQNKITDAINLFETLLKRNPNYVGSYYHLAKLYELVNNEALTIATYQKGIEIATQLNERHLLGELRSAYEEYTM